MTAASGVMAQDVLPTAKPIGSPGAWIPENSYPAAAKASAEEGRVAFTLTVDETGHASDCKVTATSESPLLDETTCNLMLANARFTPARDKKGKPTESRWSSSVRWKLEIPPSAPAAPVAVPASAPVKR
ncbi:MAG: energy transducer TonB [Sphingomonas sp.]|uniref:energy transducer TonB n=1 Tax=Sphingomonas sp. TaxID=28214 RepID=UPI001AC8E194|nr:energy transducer TonB [Sphingomonas sp.]MBN8807572.1 energy transducer TonB [Sphingomonas sp.]